LASKTQKRTGWSSKSWLNLRMAVQIVAFLGFLLLFLNADALLMGLDPLAMLANLISSRRLEALSAIALVMLALSFVFGRAWCGWLCPMGTLLDWFSFNKWRGKRKNIAEGWRSAKYVLLIAVIGAAAFSSLALLVFDPLTIMVRTFSAAVWPALDSVTGWIESGLNRIGPLQNFVTAMDNFLRPALLPTNARYYPDGLIMGLIFIAILGLNLLTERFWCRYLCPLGAIYGLTGKISLLRRKVDSRCINCKLCENACPTGTIRRDKGCSSDPGECIMCLKCMDSCACGTSDFGLAPSVAKFNSYDPSRRQFFLGMGTVAVLSILFKAVPWPKISPSHPIRPPGSMEGDMLAKCIRCGLCVKVCPTGAIQPSLTGSGAEAFWTPVIVPRTGFCQYSCNACGQSCPVAAIPPLTLDVKKATPIGFAIIDRNRCLPWSQDTPCIVCEEMCPIPQKAITLTTVETTNADGGKTQLQRPAVLTGRCIGCGLCEFKCPVEGQAAIRVAV
jgi:MauM/NapG family ferredoxin protein